jgi:hypothetical protein
MKLNGRISVGNIIVIVTLIASLAMAWGAMTSNISRVRAELEKKADKEIVSLQFEYIKQQLEEIKQRLK